MRQVSTDWGGVLTVCAAAVPFVLVLLLMRPRRAIEIGIVAGTLPWLWMIGTPTDGERGMSLVPLRDLATVATGSPSTAVVQIGGNLLVFAALGFLLPMRYARWAGVGRIAALGAVASVTVESAQWVLDLGRVSSIDDVLVNAAGAALAACASRRFWARPPAEAPEIPEIPEASAPPETPGVAERPGLT